MSREHGRVKYVVEACRCDVCRAGQRDYERERRARTAPTLVGADRARQHVRWLSENGVGLKQIVKVSGVSHGALWKLMYGDPKRFDRPSKRIKRETETAILSVMPDQGADGARVPAGPTRQHVETLVARGWSKVAIARHVHGPQARALQMTGQYVTRATARAVEALLDKPVEYRMTRHGTPVVPEPAPPVSDDELRDEARRQYERTRKARQRATDPALDADSEATHIDIHPLPEGIDLSWRTQGACRRPEYPPWMFFPARGDSRTVNAAKAVCARCPVVEQCLEFALLTKADGIWAGTSEKQRRSLRKQVAA